MRIDLIVIAEFMMLLSKEKWQDADSVLIQLSNSTPHRRLTTEEEFFLRALDDLIVARIQELRG